MNDVVNVFGADGNPDQILRDAAVDLLLVAELLVRRRPRMDGKGLGIADARRRINMTLTVDGGGGWGCRSLGQVGNQLEAVDDLTARRTAALDPKRQHSAVPAREVFRGQPVRRVALQTGVTDPRHMLMLFQPLRQPQRVCRVSLGAEAEGLEPEEELLRRKRVQTRAEIAQDLHANADGEGDGTERVPEFEAMVSLRRLVELGKALGMLAPIKLAAVDHDPADRGAVPSDPFGC